MGVPENSAVVIPRLVCPDAQAAVKFCVEALGAASINERPGPDGTLAHALLTIGPAMIMIEREWPSLPSRVPQRDGSSPVVIFVYVPDVDATFARSIALGATIIRPLENQFWGDRTAWIMDPSGHVWTIASRIEDTTSEERTNRWSAILKEQ